MDRLLGALTALVSRPGFDGAIPEPPRELKVDLRGAPPSVQSLANAMASHYFNVYLGELAMFEGGGGGALKSLAGIISAAAERGGIDLPLFLKTGGPNGTEYDPEKTLELGADAGGMSYFGVGWSGNKLGLVVVEFEDPIAENLLMHFESPAQFTAFLDYKKEGEEAPDVEALKASIGLT